MTLEALMPQLWLKFTDENGDTQRLAVEDELFTIGRHSANDLTIADSRLSREHVRIERSDGEFFVSDAGSSNGTTINGEKLAGPVKLNDGDILNLGGGLKITAEMEEASSDETPPAIVPDASAPPIPVQTAYPPIAVPPASQGIPTSLFIIAPLLGLIVLAVIGGLILIVNRGKQTDVAERGDDYSYSSGSDDETQSSTDDDTPSKAGSPLSSSSERPTPSTTPSSSTSPDESTGPPVSDDSAKVEQAGASFLRQIAQNEPKAFITGDQAKRVEARIKQIGRSAALAANINDARKNAAQIKALAVSKNLTPEFLAVAAITKLGNSRGDVFQSAQSVADVYGQLATQIGNEFSDDALLMVAAYDQGSAGDTMKMRNMLQDLATKSSEGVRTIRSIWFLEKNGKITAGEFDRAINFLAIGTITQNPKAFDVNAEPLKL